MGDWAWRPLDGLRWWDRWWGSPPPRADAGVTAAVYDGAMAHENESHAEMLQNVAGGTASILSDETLPGGRFQVVATIMGGDFALTNWRQDGAGDWNSDGFILLKHDAATRLVALLHSSGYSTPLVIVP